MVKQVQGSSQVGPRLFHDRRVESVMIPLYLAVHVSRLTSTKRWLLRSNLVNGLFVVLSIMPQSVDAKGSQFVCLSSWLVSLYEGESSRVMLKRAGTHILNISLFQFISRSCQAVHVALSLLWFSCVLLLFCLQHVQQSFSGSFLFHIL